LAWHYLQLGNRIMAAHLSYDFQKEQRNFLQIKSIFRAPFPTSGVQDKTAIFIAGMPRSGSTLVEQILASHSQVGPGSNQPLGILEFQNRNRCRALLLLPGCSLGQHTKHKQHDLVYS